MVEWCETMKRMAPACCFEDCCIEYCEDGVARQARSHCKVQPEVDKPCVLKRVVIAVHVGH